MKIKLNTVCCAGTLVVLGLTGPAATYSQDASGAPLGIRLVQPGEPGYQRGVGTTFLVTNHTSNTLIPSLAVIECQAGTNWVEQMRLQGPLRLSAAGSTPMSPLPPDSPILKSMPAGPPGSAAPRKGWFAPGLTTSELEPHLSAFTTIKFSGTSTPGPAPASPGGYGMNFLAGQPTGGVWRLRLSVQGQLTETEEAAVRAVRLHIMERQLRASGITNAFSETFKFFGSATTVVGPEVLTWR